MPRAVTITFNDGTSHVYQNVPDAATPDQVEARAAQDFAGKQVTALAAAPMGAPRAPFDREAFMAKEREAAFLREAGNTREFQHDIAKATGETALTLASGAIAQPVAGITGLVALPFVGKDRAADLVRKVGEGMTYSPRSNAGQNTLAAIGKPLQYIADKSDAAGQVVADATNSPLAGALTTGAIQTVPALLAPEVRGAIRSVATGAAKGGAAAVRGVGTAAKATTSAVDAAKAAAAQAKAKTYAGGAGLVWDDLGDSVRAQLTQIAADGGDLSALDPAALARQAKFESLPVKVPATRGTLERSPSAMRREANAAATAEGAPIANIQQQANAALIQNLDVLKGKVSGAPGAKTAATATNAEGAGASVQGAMRGKLELQKAKVRKLYEDADAAGDTLQTIDATGILGAVGDTIDQPHFGYAQSWLKANAPKIDAGGVTIRDIEKLRKQAVAKAMNGGEDGFYAGELIKAIDAATEGAGGDLYKAARAARKAQAMEFQEQGAVSDLVSMASRTDRTTALENTVKSVTSGSLEDIRTVKRSLLTGGDGATRTAGRAAWRDVRAQVLQRIKDDATKGVAPLADGSPNLQPGGLKRALDGLGPDKLEEIFGPGTARQLQKIMEVAQDAKTIPPTGGASVGSSTVQNVLTFLGKGLDKVPVVGKTATNVLKGASKLSEMGQAARDVKAATGNQLSDAAATAAQRAAAAARKQKIGKTGDAAPLVPLGAMYSEMKERQSK